jgi:hypothetical protein
MDELERIAKRIQNHEERISKIESLIKEKLSDSQIPVDDKAIPDDIRNLIGATIDGIKTHLLVAIILKFYGNLTKAKQIQILKKLGKKEADSLRSGNYNRDVESKGLVHRVGKTGRDVIYSLTEKGKIEAEQMLRKLAEGKLLNEN